MYTTITIAKQTCLLRIVYRVFIQEVIPCCMFSSLNRLMKQVSISSSSFLPWLYHNEETYSK